MRRDDFAIFLNWFVISGRYRPDLPVVAQVTKEVVELYYLELEKADLSFNTRARRLNGLYAALRLLDPPAKKWLWLQKAAKECETYADETRLVPREQPTSKDLVGVAVELFRRSEQDVHSDVERAVLFRDGVLVLFLAVTGIRRHSLAVMEIGVNLKVQGDDWTAEWPASQMKGGRRAVQRLLPPLLMSPLLQYLEKHSPVLLSRAASPMCDAQAAVWLSDRGTRLSEAAIYKRVCKCTEEVLNVRIGPHRFRHAGATTLAVLHPEEVALATPWLTHLSPRSASKSYILAEDLEASRRFARAVLGEHSERGKSDRAL
jgi:integrase